LYEKSKSLDIDFANHENEQVRNAYKKGLQDGMKLYIEMNGISNNEVQNDLPRTR